MNNEDDNDNDNGEFTESELWRETLNARGRDIIGESQFMAVLNLRITITKRCCESGENLSKGKGLSLTRLMFNVC